MTVYVDDARIPAVIRGNRSRWSHLTADTKVELHDLARELGLKREWFTERCRKPCRPAGIPCPHWHYDVTDPKRTAAIGFGAMPVETRQLADIIRRRSHSQHRGGKGSRARRAERRAQQRREDAQAASN